MADHHHHHHRPNRLSLPPRATFFTTPTTTATTPRSYPLYSYPSMATPTPTLSKHRLSLQSAKPSSSSSSFSFLLLLLFSLRSLYSLLPFLRSSPPSFSLFPFSFLISFLSFLLSLSFTLFSNKHPRNHPKFSLSSLSNSQLKLLLLKSFLLSIIFLLRFQALRYCGTAAMILAELSGNLAGRLFSVEKTPKKRSFLSSHFIGFCFLFIGLMLLSLSWDRVDCFPINKTGFSIYAREGCVRIWPMLLPFLSGFLGCYEKVSMNSGSIRLLGRKRVRLISLFFTTVMLFVPAVISFLFYEIEGGGNISIENLGWPLVNTVVFGVLLSENYNDDNDKLVSSKDFQREFVVTFVYTIVLELFYFDELSLSGLLLCGLLLYFAVRELDPVYSSYTELGIESSESFSMSIMKPIRHILSERKSRKIALFLLINTGYMVVEFVAGFMSNSLGLISDACHMLFDCAALAIGLYASYISRLPANNQFNYGRGRFEILSGYANAVFLVLVGALIVLESFERILDPQEISTNSILTVSIGGLIVNVMDAVNCALAVNSITVTNMAATFTMLKITKNTLSVMATMTMLTIMPPMIVPTIMITITTDTKVITRIIIMIKEQACTPVLTIRNLKVIYYWHVVDPNRSNFHLKGRNHRSTIIVTLTTIWKESSCMFWPTPWNSAEILLQRLPRAQEQGLNKAMSDVMKMKGVCRVQNLHVWSFTNTDIVGTVHLHISAETDKAATKAEVSQILHDAGIKDLTLQVECAEL
ncbi:probable zinc transporter protein DDB_G0291141 isoform X2 [Durio zibethinus]|uniref:Probable zinc transporter protein DDB_G0291141 isoform X2 n=1 Tax=Durio zibethinus TaxID=66656 RepID=A0A6P5YFP7_DURZI|nr:probable zinc transporter protein DDB_G0291141 isoform X2 [Durio zibethinus]